MSAHDIRSRRPGFAILLAPVLLAGLLAAGVASNAEEPPPPGPTYTGEHCSVTCGRFKEDTCEVWDPAGAPSCRCSVGDVGSYTECRCADGSTPTRCKCSSSPQAACDPHNPQDDCGSCQCQC